MEAGHIFIRGSEMRKWDSIYSLLLGKSIWRDCLWLTVGRMKGYRTGLL